jgi:DNA-binding transcriptional regulator of glucitol operon
MTQPWHTGPGAAISPLARRDTLNGMETPGSAPSAPAVPGETRPDVPDPDAGQAASGPVWRFLVEPRWLAWLLIVVLSIWGMLWLGDWQFHRAMAGNGLSWAYTFEWPLFAGFAIVFWARTVRDEFRLRRGTAGEGHGAEAAGPALPEGIGVRPIEQPADDADDAELASYNAYLAKLNAEVKGHNKWLGSR